MFQCLGLGNHETGGCGEDWYHPGCLMGLGPRWYENMPKRPSDTAKTANGTLPSISEDAGAENNEAVDENDVPLPEGFPEEDEFDHFICYKCVEAHPWIKRYAGTDGFLSPVFSLPFRKVPDEVLSNKRKLEDDDATEDEEGRAKRAKSEQGTSNAASMAPISEDANGSTETVEKDMKKETPASCKWASMPPSHSGKLSLFVKPGFREQFCRCEACFPKLKEHPQLLEEEDAYEPPLTDDSASENGSNHGSGSSLLERGESALKNVDRVRAIEGVMAYNHLKDKLKPFFQQFAESGQAVGAEDIKEYFAKLRGDEQAIKEAGDGAKEDNRKEESGY